MEKDEPLIREIRHGDVTVRVFRKVGADGRMWPNYRSGRYYTKDKQERFTVDQGSNDLPIAVWQLFQAYLLGKANPQELKIGDEE